MIVKKYTAAKKVSRFKMDDAYSALTSVIQEERFDEIFPVLKEYRIGLKTVDRDGRQFFWHIVSCVDSRTLPEDAPLPQCIRYFLECGAEVNHFDCFGDTVLHVAAVRSNPAVVQMLIDYGAVIDFINYHGLTPLDMAMLCFEDDQPEVVSLLLEAGADPYRRMQENMAYETPAMFAETLDIADRKQLKEIFFGTLEKMAQSDRKRRRVKRSTRKSPES